MIGLTDKQMDVLIYIEEFIDENGYPPTVREVATKFDMTAKGAFDHLNAIQHKGYISRTKKISRGIKING